MSFLDRVKSFFSGASKETHEHSHDDSAGHSYDEPRAGESSLEASLGVPPAIDPLGTPAPEAAPEPVTPPPAGETGEAGDADQR